MNDPEHPAPADEERQRWDAVAPAWDEWWPRVEAGAQGLNDRLVELAGVAEGHRVLDVATGLGEPALTAARRTGPRGQVLGIDLSDGMLRFAARRARAAGLDQVSFRQGDAAGIDPALSAPAGFDAALCRWGLMLMPAPGPVAARVLAALRPGARFAAAVWSSPEEVPFIAVGSRVLAEALGLPPPDPEAPGPFRMRDPDALPRLLRDAGFEAVEAETRSVTMEFATPAEYARFIAAMSAQARALLAGVDPATRGRIDRALAAAVAGFCGADGRVRLTNRSHCAVGRRPRSAAARPDP